MTAEWISALTNIALAIGILVTVWQLISSQHQVEMLRREIVDSQDRSHHNDVIRAIAVWKRNIDKTESSTIALVNNFSINECRMLRQCKPFAIDAQHARLIEPPLQGLVEESRAPRMSRSAAPILLDKQHLSQIFRLVTAHLDSLEVCLQHWLLGTADREVIESELQHLVNPERNEYVLENFRIALGGARAYPAIDAFVVHLKDKLMPTAPTPRNTLG